MIRPTVGRVVWFHPGDWDAELRKFQKGQAARTDAAETKLAATS
jgi:hypothetical protein